MSRNGLTLKKFGAVIVYRCKTHISVTSYEDPQDARAAFENFQQWANTNCGFTHAELVSNTWRESYTIPEPTKTS